MTKNLPLDYKLMGERIKQARKIKRYTQAQISEIIDMSSKNFSQLERGETGISVPTLIALCRALEVSTDYILFGVEKNTQHSSISRMLSELNEEQQLYAEKILDIFVQSCKNGM